MKVPEASNHIHYLLAPNGDRIESQKGVTDHCVDYFKGILGSEVGQKMFIQDVINMLLPDGYSSEFFTGSWSIVGAEVCEAVNEFFTSGKLLKY